MEVNYQVTTEQTTEHDKRWVFFIGGVYYSQPGYETSEKAMNAGVEKVKSLKSGKKRK